MATYNRGDCVKVEFADESTGVGEWMWMRVTRCDDQRQLVFGTLDSEPLNDYGGQIGVGSELAIGFSQIREHRRATEFRRRETSSLPWQNFTPHRRLVVIPCALLKENGPPVSAWPARCFRAARG